MNEVWTVNIAWDYEGESLKLATTDETEAWQMFREMSEEESARSYTHIEIRQWVNGSCVRELVSNLGQVKEWRNREWVEVDG